ncbi:hypothetical protein N7470_005845 [Penicillium chermesinum]|nr:hypothetical protein N7470_005845 [Penicillium chermesinum]
MELSLHSGGEYEVFILSHVKDKAIRLSPQDDEYFLKLKAKFIPPEFHDITVLFNDQTLESWYPNIEEHSPMFQYWQPVQAFAQSHADFDYYWQIEMDSRFTGHSYHYLEKAVKFAKEQPRKYLWERNAYFYIPGSHGTWEQFADMVASSMRGYESSLAPKVHQANPLGPRPPVNSPDDDDFEWGIGEEADFISFLPIFDPINTEWPFSDKVWGLPENVPRRASPVAMGRVSKVILQGLHDMQVEKKIRAGI